MARLTPEVTPAYKRDIKRLDRKHIDDKPLEEVIELILENTRTSRELLRTRHGMHTLSGSWKGSSECHVCNVGDWLLIWRTTKEIAVLQRTGTHDELFGWHSARGRAPAAVAKRVRRGAPQLGGARHSPRDRTFSQGLLAPGGPRGQVWRAPSCHNPKSHVGV